MIESSYLSCLKDFPRSFSSESAELKHLLTLTGETRMMLGYLKSAFELENKFAEGMSKTLVPLVSNYQSECSANEDLVKFFRISQIFLMLFENLARDQVILSRGAVNGGKLFDEIREGEISLIQINKKAFENLHGMVKDLNTSRGKYKTLYSKMEKLFKELEAKTKSGALKRSDIGKDSKLIKEDEKILALLTEFDQCKEQFDSTKETCLTLENSLNEKLKILFTGSFRYFLQSMNHLKSALNSICEHKVENLHKVRINHILNISEHLNTVHFDLDRQEENYNQAKGITIDFSYFLGDLNNNYNLIINLDEHFNKNNYQTSQFCNHLLSYFFSFQQTILTRKNQILGLSNLLNDISKNYESNISNFNKQFKALIQPTLNILKGNNYIKPTIEFFKNFLELQIKNEEEFLKFFNNNLNSKIENILMDITTDELFFHQIYYKLQKEHTNFTNSLNKILKEKEKVYFNLEKVKEDIQKNSEDVDCFSKYESQLLSLRTQEGNINETCLEVYKNYRKFLDEFVDVLKRKISSYKEKENIKMKELKESMIEIVNSKDKSFIQITDFLQNKSKINFDKNAIHNYAVNVCVSFLKEFGVIEEKEEKTSLVNKLINDLLNNEQMNLDLSDFNFLNKLECIVKKDFSLNEIILNKEDLEYYEQKQQEYVIKKIANASQRFSITSLFTGNNSGNKTNSNEKNLRNKSKSQINSPKNLSKALNPFNFDNLSTNSADINLESKSQMEKLEINAQNLIREPELLIDNDNISMKGEFIVQAPVNTNYSFLSELNLIPKLSNLNKNRLDSFKSVNKRNFQSVIINNHKIGDLPLSYIFQSMFHPDTVNEELGKKKNFFMSYMEIRQDYNVVLSKIQEEEWSAKIPQYYSSNDLKFTENEENLKTFISEEIEKVNLNDFPKIEYKYDMTHPILKKKFMGPSKLDIEDIVKVYFVSPVCLIVEVFSYMSGFMMMDTFYSITQYKFETNLNLSKDYRTSGKVFYDTNLTISFQIEFVKDSWFKSKIMTEALSDMDDSIKSEMMPTIQKVIEGQKIKYKRDYEIYLNGRRNENVNRAENIIFEEKNEEVFDLTGQFKFVENPNLDRREENSSPPKENPSVITSPTSAQSQLPTIPNNLVICAVILTLLLIFSLFPFQFSLLITINLAGLFILYSKLGEINERLQRLENKKN